MDPARTSHGTRPPQSATHHAPPAPPPPAPPRPAHSDGTEVIASVIDASEGALIGTTSYGYDNANRLTSTTDKNAGGTTTIDSYTYTYNSAGLVGTVTSTLGPSATYTYLWKWQPQTDRNSDFCGSGPPRAGRHNRHFRGLLPGQRAQRDRDGLRCCQHRLRDVILQTPGETASSSAGTQPD